MTLEQLWKEGCEALQAAGIEEYELDARYLLMEAFHLDAAHFLLEKKRPLEKKCPLVVSEEAALFYDMVKRRAGRVPLQYLLGYQEFMGLRFQVNRHVLIPRQDTETLVEEVLKRHPDKELRILDLCTGSGCIAVSLSVLGGYREVMATDISHQALEVARSNAYSLQKDAAQRVTFAQGDLFSALRTQDGPFDVIVSNPPYIPSEVIRGLMPEVKDFEPRAALDGEADGLAFYRRILAECKDHLTPGGAVYLEIGSDQGAEVSKLLAEAGFAGIRIVRDATGLDRVAAAVYENRI